ncbi:MAG: MarR family winged helix-turn-helix transcriptional regulator [Gemmatimonadota bacterium]
MMTMREELQQTKPFEDPAQEAYLGVVRTASELEHGLTELLRPHGVTRTQYNVLRILRGAGEDGLFRSEVGERMLTPVPDATRLLDRLEASGFIRRARDADDRRYVRTRITPKGLAVLDELDDPVLELHREQFEALTEREVRALIDLLDRLREPE